MAPRTKWLATLGVIGAVGVGTTVGLVTTTGASTPTTSHTANPATTVSFDFTATIGRGDGPGVTLTGTGVADFPHDAASLTVVVPAAVAQRIPGGSDSPESINAVLSGQIVYLEIPSLASKVGEPWISIALPSTASSRVDSGLAKMAAALGDVNDIADVAKTHGATVTPLPTATVDGTQATGIKIVASQARGGNTRTITATTWADAADRLVQATVSSGGSGGHPRLTVSTTFNFSGYGSPVTITVPPSSQTKSIPSSVITNFFGLRHFGSHLARGNWSHMAGWTHAGNGPGRF
jgi:hypothetical protein